MTLRRVERFVIRTRRNGGGKDGKESKEGGEEKGEKEESEERRGGAVFRESLIVSN